MRATGKLPLRILAPRLAASAERGGAKRGVAKGGGNHKERPGSITGDTMMSWQRYILSPPVRHCP